MVEGAVVALHTVKNALVKVTKWGRRSSSPSWLFPQKMHGHCRLGGPGPYLLHQVLAMAALALPPSKLSFARALNLQAAVAPAARTVAAVSASSANPSLPQFLLSAPAARVSSRRRVAAMASSGSTGVSPVQKSDEEWRAVLSPEQFRILRQKGTEYPGTGKYNKHKEDGVYECAGCGTPLYKSTTKFDSGCGWPAFFEGLPGAITETRDPDGRRIEITCTACGGHLGHVFKGEGFKTPTDARHCVNSVSLTFTPANKS